MTDLGGEPLPGAQVGVQYVVGRPAEFAAPPMTVKLVDGDDVSPLHAVTDAAGALLPP